jgi:lysozyme family protein
MTIEEDQKKLSTLSIDELRAIRNDFRNSEEICKAAGDLEDFLLKEAARSSYLAFQAGTAEFARLTNELLEIARRVPPNPVTAVATKINKLIVDTGDLALRKADIVLDDLRGKTDDLSDAPGSTPLTSQPASGTAPSTGSATVINSKKLDALQAEYVALFNTAKIDPNHLADVRKVCKVLLSNRALYETAGNPLGIPWSVVAVIHAMERLNFGCHLHNGDPLDHRTVHEPKGRPATGTEPFTWEQSAEDALKRRRLDRVGQGSWTLARTLYELEGYNGFGYRKFNKATPYLWSFCQHYDKGRYVADHKYDPDARSRQCGAAVLLKQLESDGEIQIPR